MDCGGRPNPEGAGGSVAVSELSHYGRRHEDPGKLCQRCHIMGRELNRQALAVVDPAALEVRNRRSPYYNNYSY